MDISNFQQFSIIFQLSKLLTRDMSFYRCQHKNNLNNDMTTDLYLNFLITKHGNKFCRQLRRSWCGRNADRINNRRKKACSAFQYGFLTSENDRPASLPCFFATARLAEIIIICSFTREKLQELETIHVQTISTSGEIYFLTDKT